MTALSRSGPLLDRASRVAILGGGGLGDLLAARPLLQALDGLDRPAAYCSARFAQPGLLHLMGVRAEEVVLPREPRAAAGRLRDLGDFDLLYLGPHPTWRTRLLARTMKARRIWAQPGQHADQFLPEVLALDAQRLGLVPSAAPPYGTLPLFVAPPPQARPPAGRYLVVHLTARPHWHAKQWPLERWAALLEQLAGAGIPVLCLGTPDEAAAIDAALERVAPAARTLVRIETALALSDVERIIAHSAGVVCHNSGIMHIAVALQRPTVVLTGSSARFWRPTLPWVLNLDSGRCGLACNQHDCPVPFFDARCIRDLGLAEVFAAVRRHVLEPSTAAPRAAAAASPRP